MQCASYGAIKKLEEHLQLFFSKWEISIVLEDENTVRHNKRDTKKMLEPALEERCGSFNENLSCCFTKVFVATKSPRLELLLDINWWVWSVRLANSTLFCRSAHMQGVAAVRFAKCAISFLREEKNVQTRNVPYVMATSCYQRMFVQVIKLTCNLVSFKSLEIPRYVCASLCWASVPRSLE